MKKSKKTAATDLKDVPFLAAEVFRDQTSPFASLAAPAAGKRKRPFTADEMAFRKSHVAIEKVRRAPTPAALLALLRSLLPDLEISPRQTTVQLAWAEVLLREVGDEDRFDVRGLEMDRVALAVVLLQAAAPLRATPPFLWVLPYLESLLASASPGGSPTLARDRAAAALEAAEATGEPLSVRMALTRMAEPSGEPAGKPIRGARPDMVLRKDGHCLLLGGAVVSLTPREFTLLRAAAQEGTLSRERAMELLQKQPPLSGMATVGIVEESALQAHRRSILAKVEKKAGKALRDRLARAFRSEMRLFVYDAKVLPISVE